MMRHLSQSLVFRQVMQSMQSQQPGIHDEMAAQHPRWLSEVLPGGAAILLDLWVFDCKPVQ
jgi:hypothetical protein